MKSMTSIGRRDLFTLGAGITVALLVAGCGTGAVQDDPTPSTSPTGREPYLTIVQGTVGTLGSARVGYVNRAAAVDQVSDLARR